MLGTLEGEFAIAAVGVPMGPVTRRRSRPHLGKLHEALEPWSTGGTYLNFSEVPSDGSTAFARDLRPAPGGQGAPGPRRGDPRRPGHRARA